MALSKERKTRIGQFAGRSLARLMRLVHRTSSIVHDPADMRERLAALHPAIVVGWHGQLMMTQFLQPEGTRAAAIVARHGDADIIGEALTSFGVELIRGAGSGSRQRDRGGAHALRGALRALENGISVVVSADVPPGPARRATIGIVTLARMSGRPILPVAAATSRFKSFDTWSRMTINLPFSKLAYVFGGEVVVPRTAGKDELERYRLDLERRLNAATGRAYALAGADIERATPDRLDGPPAAPGLGLKGYRTITSMVRPAVPLLLKLRARQGKEDPSRAGERLGEASAARPLGVLVWIHAASIGETNAMLPVMDALAAARPDLNFLLTTGTVTSAGLANRRLGPRAIHQYIPLDATRYATRFLDHWRPDLAVFTESEIWPNLILGAAERGIPLVLANGRLSSRSFSRWRRGRGLSRPLFSRFSVVLAQNETLARRFSTLGARNVIAAGNLKVDAPPPAAGARELERLGEALGTRPRLVAASTHEGEEIIIAEAHRRLAREFEGFCTIIVPRHPERGTGVAEVLKDLGLSVAQRSLGELPGDRTDVYVADTVGELGTFYALAPVAFIGGSLVDRGGQNPIEAVRCGTAVLTGPFTRNFRDSYRALLRQGGAIEVGSAHDLAKEAAALLTDGARIRLMQAGATEALATLSGALALTVEALLAQLPAEERPGRAAG